ncbi:HNH endonuclease [Sphingosinicella sp. CPCC 101087]|uniref:HNH endonuclease n=1 Tax=Sphingosinicella sp. CPCC 101087 TaxID=2497754 RepID=UPI00352A00D3
MCAGWTDQQLPDTNGFLRKAIVFRLVPLNLAADPIVEALPEVPRTTEEFNQLRARAYAAAKAPEGVQAKDAVVASYVRSKTVRDYALARANGRCESCNEGAPFETPAGLPFLEVHHIKRLTDGGPDSPGSVAAICPNCHREAHYGASAVAINDRLLALVQAVERVTIADLPLIAKRSIH